MTRHGWLLLVVLVCAGLLLGAEGQPRVRKPVCPGNYYPADPAQLYQAVKEYTAASDTAERPNRLTAILTPCLRYPISGKTMGRAFSSLKTGQYDRVIVLTPTEQTTFRGCSIPSVNLYRTPLGDIWLDSEAIRKICFSPLIQSRSVVYYDGVYKTGKRKPVHETEHGVEAILPFLQVLLGVDFKLVPITVGDMNGHDGELSQRMVTEAGETIAKIIDDRTLVVISANLTRYGPEYAFVPFIDDVERSLAGFDMEIINLLLARDTRGLVDCLDRTENPLNSRETLLVAMHALGESVRGTVLDYGTSSTVTGDASRSISFAAAAFYTLGAPPNEPREVRTLFSPPPPLKELEKKTSRWIPAD